jgi:hypothetical protein
MEKLVVSHMKMMSLIRLDRLRKTTKELMNSQCSNLDSNRGPAAYKSEALTLEPNCLA